MSIDEFFQPTGIVLTGVFTAKYRTSCGLATCEKDGIIEPGDAAQHADAVAMHLTCARRVARGQTDPYCKDCCDYHVDDCQ